MQYRRGRTVTKTRERSFFELTRKILPLRVNELVAIAENDKYCEDFHPVAAEYSKEIPRRLLRLDLIP